MRREQLLKLKNLAIGVAAVLVAHLARLGLGYLLDGRGAFVAYYPATMIATLYGGWTGGMLATTLSTVLAVVTFHTTHRSLPGLGDELLLTAAFAVANLIIVAFTDSLVVARRQAREALEAREQANQQVVQILDSITDAFATFDRDWRYVYVNDAATQLYGIPRGDFLGRTLWEQFPHLLGTEFEQRARRAMQNAQPERFEYFSKQLGRWFDYRLYPCAEGISLYGADIHERKCMAEQRDALLAVEQAAREELEQTNRLKDEFLATLSHELRTPLNSILGWASLLDGGHRLSEAETSEAIATIERNARLQAQLIEDLLEMNAIVSGKIHLEIQDLDLPLIIKSALQTARPAADAKQVQLRSQLDTQTVRVRGDQMRFQQVVLNLLSNAIKFTPPQGSVQVTLQCGNDSIQVQVVDTGQGIRPDFLPYVFERFRQADASSTRRFGGLGLGLAIVKQLVELHGGHVSATSAGENQGSTFTVTLPATARETFDQAGSDESRNGNPRAIQTSMLDGIAVLVVDDEPDALRLVKRLLEERHAVVHVAQSGAEAFDRLAAARPDVLISDIGMPDEDGYSLMRRLRAAPEHEIAGIPAVALTAFASVDDQRRARSAGYQIHLPKPIDAAELIAAVATLAGRSHAEI